PAASPSSRRPRAREDLSLHAFASGRLPLPPPSDLLGVCRRSARPLRALGRLMDDARTAPALPSMGHIGDRSHTANDAGRRALVRAMALRPLVAMIFPLAPTQVGIQGQELGPRFRGDERTRITGPT